MNLPRPKWYTVYELANYWDIINHVVDRYIETGQLIQSTRYISVYRDFNGKENKIEGRDYWHDKGTERDCDRLHINGQDYWPDKETGIYWDRQNKNGYQFEGRYIKLEEVERFEKVHEQEPLATKPDYLNPDHPWYSENLAIAIKLKFPVFFATDRDK